MDNIILSTATFCLWDLVPEQKIDICKALKFKKIQIALSTEKMVWKFIDFLNQNPSFSDFEEISIHAPWCGMKYGNNEKTTRVISGLKEIVKRLAIETVIVRVDCISDVNVLLDSGLPISIENSDRDPDFKMFKWIIEHTNLPIAFNLNRAIRSNREYNWIFNLYSHRICRILLSGFTPKQGRMPLGYSNQFALLAPIQHFDLPLVIEGLFNPRDYLGIQGERLSIYHYFEKNLCAVS